MLSYQHAYHAGGPADLHKHIVLAELLARLTLKPRGITYLETHAGRGLYDFAAAESAEDRRGRAGHRPPRSRPGDALRPGARRRRAPAQAPPPIPARPPSPEPCFGHRTG